MGDDLTCASPTAARNAIICERHRAVHDECNKASMRIGRFEPSFVANGGPWRSTNRMIYP